MPDHADKVQSSQRHSLTPEVSEFQGSLEPIFQFADNRSKATSLRNLQDLANNSRRVTQLKSVVQLVNQETKPEISSTNSDPTDTPSSPLQKKSDGLPSELKSGVENLSGFTMDDVKVHRNSDEPAAMQAHAFAQGTDIHLGPGQEKYLPHEAWHVVQQKQGRVKPTVQQKPDSGIPIASDKVNINDDAGLEREADTMGKKALQTTQKQAISSKSDSHDHTITQFQKDQKTTGGNPFATVKEIDQKNASAEAKMDPKSSANKDQLKALQENGADMGEGAQIKLQGELTTAAKLNRFIGKESTYSKLLRKVEDFNKSQDVSEKQAILKELKPLARAWLANPEHAESVNQNEELKRQSLQKFLDQTTSTYPSIMDKYKGLQTKMQNFLANPITNRSVFQEAIEEYKTVTELVQNFKTTYPPSLNLLYLSEMEAINAAEKELTKSGTKKGSKFDSGLGFSVDKPVATFDLPTGEYRFSGELDLALSGILTSKGTVNVDFNNDLSLKDITVIGTSCRFALQGLEIEFLNFTYDFKAKQFITQEATGSIEILGTQVLLNAIGASIKDGIADFESLEGSITGIIDTQLGLKVKDPTITYTKGKSIEMNGELDLEISGLANASGEVMVRLDNKNTIEEIQILKGAAQASYEGITLELSGVTYNYSEDTFVAEMASGQASIFEQKVTLIGSGVTIKKRVFDFEKIEGVLPNVDLGFFSMKKSIISYSKEIGAFKAKTSYEFNEKEAPTGFKDFATSGDVEIFYSPNGEKYYSIDNGKLVFNVLGQRGEVQKFSYNSTQASLLADEFKLEVSSGPINKTFTGTGISITKAGFDFESLTTSASGQTYDVKVFTLTPEDYSIIKGKDGELGVKAQGALNLTLPDYLGVKASGEVKGNLGIGFQNPTPSYEIISGKANLIMPNPLNKIGEILGDNWSSSRFEMSAGIPVFPGISAIFGIYIKYGAKFANQLAAMIELNPETNMVTLEATTNFDASVEGGVFGGIQGGSQLLLALALLLRAAGVFNMNTEVGYSKEFPLEEKPAEKKIKEDSGFFYDIKGDIKVTASLDIVATALYFFQKRFSLLLGEKSLGEFHYSNNKKSDPDMGTDSLASREDLNEAINPKLEEEAAGLTLEQLLDLDYTHRFKAKEKKETIDVIKAAETGRAEANKLENEDTGDSPKFNNIALANLQFFNEFIDKRCNWTEIYRVLDDIGEALSTKSELSSMSEIQRETYLKTKILGNIEILGESSNIAQVFVDHYHEKVEAFAEAYPRATIKNYLTLLQQKGQMLNAVEHMKKEYLHSSFWGDEAKQMKNIKTGSWFWGKSNYENFAAAYFTFRKEMITNRGLLDLVEEVGKQTGFKLVQEHQRKLESGGE